MAIEQASNPAHLYKWAGNALETSIVKLKQLFPALNLREEN